MEKFYKYYNSYKTKAEKYRWMTLEEEELLRYLKIAVRGKPYVCNLAEQIVLCRLALDKNINFE